MEAPPTSAAVPLALSAVRYGRTTGGTMNGFWGPLGFETKTLIAGVDDWPSAPAGGTVVVPRAGFYFASAHIRHTNTNVSCYLNMGSPNRFEGEQKTSTAPFVSYQTVGFRYLNAGDGISISGFAGASYTPPDGSTQYLDIVRLS